jgi:hypothetical protein
MSGAEPLAPHDISLSTLTLSNLSPGQQYYFSMSYIGPKGDEGRRSRAIFVPLAAAIPMPETPRGTSTSSLFKAASTNSLVRASRGSLDRNERWGNMHNGMPAHHSTDDMSMTPLPRSTGNMSGSSIVVEDTGKSSLSVRSGKSSFSSVASSIGRLGKVDKPEKSIGLKSSGNLGKSSGNIMGKSNGNLVGKNGKLGVMNKQLGGRTGASSRSINALARK